MIGPWLDTTLPVWLADPVNRHHPLNQGRIAWWLALPGLDGGRQWFDLIGLNHGTLTNMTSASASGWRPATRPGGWGALQFDGVDDDVHLPSIPVAATATLAFWVCPQAPTDGDGSILSNAVGTAGVFLHKSNNKIAFYYPTIRQNNTALALGAWTRLAIAIDAGAVTFYLNGTADGTSSGFGGYSAERMGNDSGDRYSGAIDDVTLYNRALSAAEVAADFDLSRRGYPGVLNRLDRAGWLAGGAIIPTGNPAALLMAM